MEAYRPQVVVTYDATGSTAPDTSRPTASPWPLPRRRHPRQGLFHGDPEIRPPRIRGDDASGVDMPEETTATEGEREAQSSHDDELIAAVVDCAPFVDAKYDALAAHASQTEDISSCGSGVSCSIASSAKRPSCGRWTARRAGPRGRPLRRPALSSARRSPPVPPAERGRSRQTPRVPRARRRTRALHRAAQESSKPKRPPFTERRNPTSVEAAKPAPSARSRPGARPRRPRLRPGR